MHFISLRNLQGKTLKHLRQKVSPDESSTWIQYNTAHKIDKVGCTRKQLTLRYPRIHYGVALSYRSGLGRRISTHHPVVVLGERGPHTTPGSRRQRWCFAGGPPPGTCAVIRDGGGAAVAASVGMTMRSVVLKKGK